MALPLPPEAAPIHHLTPKHSHWPALWKEIPDPPTLVHVQGQVQVLAQPLVAIVGTRRASLRGRAFARALAMVLTGRGWGIVSGLALGIDAAAHRGALEGGGNTIAVMGTGLGRVYPAVHGSLRREIEQQGCCLTEYEEKATARRYHFPQRNRLIAALVKAVVVVEAPVRSGALVTAQMALDYDREIFAVPGPVDQDISRGCHQLLRQGAHLMESAEDLERVLEIPPDLAPTIPKHHGHPGKPAPGSAADWILDRLDFDGVSRDVLRRQFPGTEEMWGQGLLTLELAGLLKRLPGGRLGRTLWKI